MPLHPNELRATPAYPPRSTGNENMLDDSPPGSHALRSLRIYFAGSIRGGRDLVHRYRSIVVMIESMGHTVLTKHVADPKLTAQTDRSQPEHVYRRDMNWLHSADAIIAEVSVPSLGVGFELGIASELGKPVLCLFDSRRQIQKLSHLVRGVERDRFYTRTYVRTSELRRMISDFLEEQVEAKEH